MPFDILTESATGLCSSRRGHVAPADITRTGRATWGLARARSPLIAARPRRRCTPMKAKMLLFTSALVLILLIGLVASGAALATPTVHHERVAGTIFATFEPAEPPILDPGGKTWHEAGTWAAAF